MFLLWIKKVNMNKNKKKKKYERLNKIIINRINKIN